MGGHREGRRTQVGAGPLSSRVVRVLPDEPAIDKTFDYLVPDALGDQVRVGAMVRIPLHGRRVGGWVVADGVTPHEGVELRAIAKVTGWGPPPGLFDLAEWAAWRWAGRPASLLRSASPDRAVGSLPQLNPRSVPLPEVVEPLLEEAFARPGVVLRLPPAADGYEVALAAAGRGPSLILAPSAARARHIGIRLRRAGADVALLPDEWAQARAGATAVGARAGAWAPTDRLHSVVVIDEHDEVYQEERTPTWHARDVLMERARRADVPCVLTSPMPTLEAQEACRLVRPSRTAERAGWPVVQVVDRRREDVMRTGLYSPALVGHLRSDKRVVCVLNRTGRSRLLACRSCTELARCVTCGSAVHETPEKVLRCHRCGSERPVICIECGATGFKNLRVGVTRAREDLEALVGERVVEVTGSASEEPLPRARVFVGTEAVLHQVPGAEVVAFLDFDQELLAPRYRAGEQALALLVRAARLVGARERGGRIVVQTRLPRHEAILSAVHADPGRLTAVESERRRELGLPPFGALAEVSSTAAATFIDRLGTPLGMQVDGPIDGRWRVRAPDHQVLCDALASVERPPGRLRVAVDPLRI